MNPVQRNPGKDASAIAAQIAAWADSPAEHAHAAEALTAWGERAIPGLRAYLERGPQVIPQPRCFAIAMLARLHADAVAVCLRDVLHANPLHSLSAAFAESEYVVKSDTLDALLVRRYPALADDIAFGVKERLRTAVIAAGRLQQTRLADTLTDLLDDDVLAEAAIASLIAMGMSASHAIVPRLDAWIAEAEWSARRRIALVRAMHVLQQTGPIECVALQRALNDAHPAVRAAAALLARPVPRDAAALDALLHGAVGFDRELADACREALGVAGQEAFAAAERALRRNAEPDLYGDLRSLSSESHDWLVHYLQRLGASRGVTRN